MALLVLLQLSSIGSTEITRIKVWNQPNGTIEASSNKGKSWREVGRVLFPTNKTNSNGYTAARWVADGKVAATAVNAIHIKTATAPDGDGIIFSLLPREFLQPPSYYRSYLSSDTAIYTDIPAGEEIFGGGVAPFVGNSIKLAYPDGTMVDIPKGYQPHLYEKFYIIVEKPQEYPRSLVIENVRGGEVTISYYNGRSEVIARVVRPVSGIGRFEGSRYASVGRIRANHAGVLDVSTSTLGRIGGFQIVPAYHGQKFGGPQWLVVGPVSSEAGSLEGTAPLFKAFIRPDYLPDDLLNDAGWMDRLLERFLVEVKLAGSDKWQSMPIREYDDYYLTGQIPPWSAKTLQNVVAFRFLFPLVNN
ncbi:hypothetical protein A2311_02235 [candidate division WOR-1 bacterium RIFOXYB2_FULL_48_7]|uniref:Uncharacterized protein n=1 Tax=candidate division WOR-1 bacterium RIFOXYB2_FULL_48_7 TaxID=1802583 RepID=A0A1F4TTR7_UNCSA|nr:MAG: hypothetical protein A2311_02235 [candidate division WOR-1 bacterium RIFOXYB2_FULL_48_7]